MTPFETISTTILMITLAGGLVFGGIQIGRWMERER